MLNNYNNVQHISFAKEGSTNYAFAVNNGNNGFVYRLLFPNNCSAVPAVSSQPNPSVQYLQQGNYNITLKATSALNNSQSITKAITVTTTGGSADVCSFADFTVPVNLCVQQPVTANNISEPEAIDFRWDFCSGDLKNAPFNPVSQSSLSALNGSRFYDIYPVYDTDFNKWRAFAVDQVNDNLYRLDFNNGPSLPPICNFLGNPFSRLDNPSEIRVIKENNRWYGLIGNTGNNTVSRITFAQSNGLNSGSGSLSAANFVSPNKPNFIEVVQDSTEGIFVITASFVNANLGIVWFGNNINNQPVSFIVPGSQNTGGITSYSSLSVIRYCDKYIVIAGSDDNQFF